ncbi:MAG: DesA family fatty acid desaturase [Candidatus Comchoanobacterales bacterium]
MIAILHSGLWPMSVLGKVIYTLVLTHIAIIAVTVYFHRAQAHRSIEVHPYLGLFFRVWIWMTSTMVTTHWVAVHRKHHAKVETPEDPHSPRIHGILAIFFNGVSYYRRERNNPETIKKYSIGCPNDWFERSLIASPIFMQNVGSLIMMLINIVLFGVKSGFLIWLVQMLWMPVLAAGGINGLGHYFGYRNYSTEDDSTNIMPWGILIGGEELHNNHHAFPTSPKLSMKAFEFDIGYVYIKLFERLQWIKIKQKPMSLDQPAEKISDIIRAKVLLLSKLDKQVIMPLLKKKKQYLKSLNKYSYSEIKQVLLRPFLDANQNQLKLIDFIKSQDDDLSLVLLLKAQLESIYSKRLRSNEYMHQLRLWCDEAERSCLRSMKNYIIDLKAFMGNVDSGSFCVAANE